MKHTKLNEWLTKARRANEVTDAELDEARKRRNMVADALRSVFPGCRIYVNGSVAHGDALNPLADVDLGCVVPNLGLIFGIGREGPRRLMEIAAQAIRDKLGPEYPNLEVTVAGQHRAVFVRFGDPVSGRSKDFTADVIIAIDNPNAPGLLIPDLPNDTWDRSDPEKHTELVRARILATATAFAHIVRLLKLWCRGNDKPLCSWHIKALALECVNMHTGQIEGLALWFGHAISELSTKGETQDPARVADPIRPDSLAVALAALTEGQRIVKAAIAYDEAGQPAHAQRELARLFPDVPTPSDADLAADDEAERLRRLRGTTGPALVTAPSGVHRPRVGSWSPR